MANPEHVNVVKQGAEAIARWRENNQGTALDLSKADRRGVSLKKANLMGADLTGANLTGADLTGANLTGADLTEADLTGADLTGADLFRANLFQVNLSVANLTEADLIGASLFGADLTEADLLRTGFFGTALNRVNLSEANLREALFGSTAVSDCDLSQCQGLEKVLHYDPSSIGMDTLARTLRGAGGVAFTPEQMAFFTGAGVSQTLLEYLPSMVQDNPLQFYSCFISFGSKDAEFAEWLYQGLTERGVRCWKFDESAVMGRGVWANIDRAIHVYDKLIVVCSKDSLGRAPVLREIERALQKEDQLRGQGASDPDVLFPIRLDSYVIDEWEHERKADVVTKVIGDFRDPEQYEQELGRLIQALSPRAWGLGGGIQGANLST